ncbi:hypothetical protein TNIN_450271 [Trichonephila inaurata madagascariensis]|uniref:C2H2-type domain-containing protein n=1 Tax=Trichonephila inaurata madagascariensis TaxID=2747483 RepID=A0A8X6Y9W9_9ARAC|nr:hypothetical protein TNIN_450271 [Trichonephila inaurata madagascariensis]
MVWIKITCVRRIQKREFDSYEMSQQFETKQLTLPHGYSEMKFRNQEMSPQFNSNQRPDTEEHDDISLEKMSSSQYRRVNKTDLNLRETLNKEPKKLIFSRLVWIQEWIPSEIEYHGYIIILSTEKTYESEVRKETLTIESNAKRNRLVRAGEKANKCDECKKEFRQKYELDKHNLIHEGGKPM